MERFLDQLDAELFDGCATYDCFSLVDNPEDADPNTVFLIPFFIMKSLKLRQRQKFGLIGVFSLGLITMAISLGRFMIYSVSNYDLSDNDGGMLPIPGQLF